MLDEIRDLYDFNRWANRRVLNAAAVLSQEELHRDMGSSFPSVHATLAHMLHAEWIWLSRWNGTSPDGPPRDQDLSTHAALTARWDAHQADLDRFVEGLTEDRLTAVVHYRNTAGTPYAEPLWQLMRHVVNHGSYHRGQVVTLLRQMGKPGVSTDLVLYYRERSQRS